MFTGLVEGTGRVESLSTTKDVTRLNLLADTLAEGARIGDSIAINGCCLTIVSIKGPLLSFDLLEETKARTNLCELKPGASVNLERALPASGRYSGHFVTGHIDATGSIRKWEQVGNDYELRIGIPPANGIYLVPKGCIAIDGISLTVADVGHDEFSVWIIPHTREVTALHERAVGNLVNLEFDLLAKYTEKFWPPETLRPDDKTMRSFIQWVHSLGYVLKGTHALHRGDDDGVIRNYSRAIEISPDDLDYYYARGHAYWHKRELGLAAADFTKAIDLNPNDFYAHVARGAIYRDKGFLQQAIRDLTWVVESDDGMVMARYLRASCYAEQQDYERAMVDLEEALKLDPHNEKFLELKARCEPFVEKRHEKASPTGNGDLESWE